MKTRTPLNVYLIGFITAVSLFLILPAPLVKTLTYAVFTFLYLYLFLSRNACRVVLTETELSIQYTFFWEKNVTYQLTDIAGIDYEKGFYDLFSHKTRGGVFVFPKYCSDRLLLKMKDIYEPDRIFLNINTRAFEFDRLYNACISQVIRTNKPQFCTQCGKEAYCFFT